MDAFARLLEDKRLPPTARELGEALGMAAASAHELVQQLVRKKYLTRDPQKARGLQVARLPTPTPRSVVPVPIVGKVSAGYPVFSPDNIDGEVLVEAGLVAGRPCFGLLVQGQSMRDAGITDGSIVIVRQQPIADSGDIVVAALDGETTVKRLYLEDACMELRPENPKFKPIRIEPDSSLHIFGKVIAVRQVMER